MKNTSSSALVQEVLKVLAMQKIQSLIKRLLLVIMRPVLPVHLVIIVLIDSGQDLGDKEKKIVFKHINIYIPFAFLS